MSRSTKRTDAKEFALQKRKRRQWLTFVRMCRYGINNFSRNAWLTVAATAVMTLTLFVVMITAVARNVLLDTSNVIRDKVDMSIYVKNDTPSKDVVVITEELSKLSTVRRVSYKSPSEGRTEFAREHSESDKTLEALKNAVDTLPGIFSVNLTDIDQTQQLKEFVDTNPTLKKNIDPDNPPSFEGSRRDAIAAIGGWVAFADKLGIVLGIILVAISSLIIFNTIRMAIFNRKDEIQMMKLIGADKGFIRGPFVVEAIVYGFIAAVIATGTGTLAVMLARDKLEVRGVSVDPTLHVLTTYGGIVLLVMIVVGALIGVISSLLATRKYLKI